MLSTLRPWNRTGLTEGFLARKKRPRIDVAQPVHAVWPGLDLRLEMIGENEPVNLSPCGYNLTSHVPPCEQCDLPYSDRVSELKENSTATKILYNPQTVSTLIGVVANLTFCRQDWQRKPFSIILQPCPTDKNLFFHYVIPVNIPDIRNRKYF